MAWTNPMTAVDGEIFTAAQFNEHIRDNLLETAPAKATGTTGYFVNNALNVVTRRDAAAASVITHQNTTSSTYTDLATVGPSVTMNTGSTVLVMFNARINPNLAECAGFVSVAVSGNTSISASDDYAIRYETEDTAGVLFDRMGISHLFTTLNPGSNTFRLKYRCEAFPGQSVDFAQRSLIVVPFS